MSTDSINDITSLLAFIRSKLIFQKYQLINNILNITTQNYSLITQKLKTIGFTDDNI